MITATAGGVASAPISVEVTLVEGSTFSVTYNNKTYTATRTLYVEDDENTNIVNIFIDEDYDATKPLNLKVTPTLTTGWTTTLNPATTYNFSDQTAEIFEISDGTTTGKFRLNIFRRPIIVSTKPAANTDTGYDSSGAPAISIRRFVQSDYYYVPTVIDDKATNFPAPSFALFPAVATPKADEILNSPVRVLRNFTTSDGNTVFFSAVDDGVADDEWNVKHDPYGEEFASLNPDADIIAGLNTATQYSFHYAVEASNGKFFGSLGSVLTAALPATEPATTTGAEKIKYFGIGGMKLHWIEGLDLSIPTFIGSDTTYEYRLGSFKIFPNTPLTSFGEALDKNNYYVGHKPLGSLGGVNYVGLSLHIRGSASPEKAKNPHQASTGFVNVTNILQLELE